MNFPDNVPLDDPMGPEFSVRIIRVCKQHNIETIGQLRGSLGEIDKWRGLGARSVGEIKDFYRQLDAHQKNLFDDPEYLRYRMENGITSVEALLHDVLRGLTRTALKGRASKEFCNHARLKLIDAAERVAKLPSQGDQ